MKSINTLLLITSSCILSACSTGYQETFDCPPGIGVGCKSINHLNRLVDQEALPSQKEEQKEKEALKSLAPENNIEHQARLNNQHNNFRVWMTGYQDKRGNFHEPRVIYVDLKDKPQTLILTGNTANPLPESNSEMGPDLNTAIVSASRLDELAESSLYQTSLPLNPKLSR